MEKSKYILMHNMKRNIIKNTPAVSISVVITPARLMKKPNELIITIEYISMNMVLLSSSMPESTTSIDKRT